MARTMPTLVVPVAANVPSGDILPGEWNAVKGDVSTLKVGQTLTNLRTQGLSLDGTTDETAAFQAVLDNASDGDVLVLDERAKLNVSNTVSLSGKRVEVRGYGDAEIIATSIVNAPIVNISHSHGGAFRGIAITGAESEFENVINSGRYGINVNASDDYVLENVRISGVTRGGRVISSARPRVDGIFFQGMATGHSLNINYHTTMQVSACDHAIVSRIHGRDCGSALLVGSGSNFGTAHQISGYNTYDNGVYISSGSDWEVVSPSFRMDPAYTGTVGTGVKMRGYRHTLLGGHFERMGIGAGVTGVGADSGDGTNGQGCKIIGATSLESRWIGFGVSDQGGLVPKDVTIAFCTDTGSGGGADAATMAPFRILTGFGHTIAYNLVQGNVVTNQAYLLGGSGISPLSRLTFVGNAVRSPQKRGVQLRFVTDSVIDGTRLEAITGDFGIHLEGSSGNTVTNTRQFGSGGTNAGIRMDSASSNNRIINNPTVTVSDVGSGNLLSGNDGSVSANIAVSGSWGGNAAGKSLAQALHALGIIRDVTTV